MTTENFDLKVDDVIVGNDGMGDRIGYYVETVTDKDGVYIRFSSTKKTKGSSRAMYLRKIEDIRLATPKEISEFEN